MASTHWCGRLVPSAQPQRTPGPPPQPPPPSPHPGRQRVTTGCRNLDTCHLMVMALSLHVVACKPLLADPLPPPTSQPATAPLASAPPPPANPTPTPTCRGWVHRKLPWLLHINKVMMMRGTQQPTTHCCTGTPRQQPQQQHLAAWHSRALSEGGPREHATQAARTSQLSRDKRRVC